MAISVAYGILFGTFFILSIFPALVVAWNDLTVGFTWLKKWLWNAEVHPPSRVEVEPAIKEDERLEKII